MEKETPVKLSNKQLRKILSDPKVHALVRKHRGRGSFLVTLQVEGKAEPVEVTLTLG